MSQRIAMHGNRLVDSAENARSHTRVHHMWAQLDPGPFQVLHSHERLKLRSVHDTVPIYAPVCVVPYNPTARLAMIRRTVSTLWPKAKGEARERREAQVMLILGTALTPS